MVTPVPTLSTPVRSAHILSASTSLETRSMLRYESCSWMSASLARRNKSTVSLRPSLHDTFNVILTYSHPMVSEVVRAQ